MKHQLTGLDHPVIGVRDLEAARAAYEEIGFFVPPRGFHPEWGTGNWCIQFANDYLELRGIIRDTDAPQSLELKKFLAEREGLMGVAFGTTGARATFASLVGAGLHPRPVKSLTRAFELPEGIVPVSFELCFVPKEEVPGLMHVVVCEHLTPERLRRPEWLRHPNGAQRIAGLVAIAAQPAVLRAEWERLFERVEGDDSQLTAWIGAQWIRLLSPAAHAVDYPDAPLPAAHEWPCLSLITLQVADRARTREFLADREALLSSGDRVLAAPARACATVLEFI